MESEDQNRPIDAVSECLLNTYHQSKINKEFNHDTTAFYKAFHKYTGKYGHLIAGFYILIRKDTPWMIAVANDEEVK